MSSWIYLMVLLIIGSSILSASKKSTGILDRKDFYSKIKKVNYAKIRYPHRSNSDPSTTLHESSGDYDFDGNEDNVIDRLLAVNHPRIHDVFDDDDDDESYQSGFGSGDGKIHDTPTCRELKRTQTPYLSCEDDGSYSPIQCQEGKCWCSDREGRKIGEGKTMMLVNCRKLVQTSRETPITSADLSTVAHSTVQPSAKTNNIDQKIKHDGEDDVDGDFHIVETDQTSTRHFEHHDGFVTNLQPSVLAGIVGGIIIGLLCAVLLVMFAVYRIKRSRGGPKYQHTTYEKTTPCPPLKGYTKNFDDCDVYA